MQLSDDIVYLKGVGPSRAKVLASDLQMRTIADLLDHFPYRYIDRSVMANIAGLKDDGQYVVLRGQVSNLQATAIGKYRERLTCDFFDGTGYMQLVWFAGTKWVRDKLRPNTPFIIMGRPSRYNGMWQMTHPELEVATATDDSRQPFLPVYNTSEKMKAAGLGTRSMARIMEYLVAQMPTIPETLPDTVLQRFHLMPRCDAYRNIHYPSSIQDLEQARARLKFEELFFLQLDYQYAHLQRSSASQGHVFGRVGDIFNQFYNHHLPFALTGAQKRVIREVHDDMKSGRQMNRLLQGDVGSGKTLVALMCMLLALDNGCQACLMAPTEILASQHFATFQRMLEGMPIEVELLSGSLRSSQKKKIKQRLLAGEINILIGTHALIEDDVEFQSLGLVVIDEQHRFGVQQRSRLWTKSTVAPHILVMTATPIPRTLAMTLYGDLDCSIIDELPPGRLPVKTYHRFEHNRPLVFSFLKQQIEQGRQVYIVYPLIEESEKMDLKNLQDGLEMVQSYFPRPRYQTSMVHGRLTAEEKASEMQRFKQGLTHIMVATTVIEVGVDVPNATVMVIENAERFGLSQLHQLRGRVGRGGGQAFCILMTKDNLSPNSKERIRTMCATNDGFKIAEADLRLRGPGDIQGLQQSGILDLRLADIVDDEPILRATRDTVRDILADDPSLVHYPLLHQHILHSKNKLLWSKIS